MKPRVTDNQRKEQIDRDKVENRCRKDRETEKTKTFQEVSIHLQHPSHPAVVQLLGFHNNGPAFLPLDASVHTTQHTTQQWVKRPQSHGQWIFGMTTLFTCSSYVSAVLCRSSWHCRIIQGHLIFLNWNYYVDISTVCTLQEDSMKTLSLLENNGTASIHISVEVPG